MLWIMYIKRELDKMASRANILEAAGAKQNDSFLLQNANEFMLRLIIFFKVPPTFYKVT